FCMSKRYQDASRLRQRLSQRTEGGLQGNLNSRNWRMPLCSFAVGRIVTENQEYHSYGGFVIDTSLNRQDEILNLLSDKDMRRIAVALGIIPHRECAMPPNMMYDLSGFA